MEVPIVSDSDDEMALAERPGVVVKRERSPSPAPDVLLDRMLNQRAEASLANPASVPLWVERIERNIGGQLGQLTEAIAGFHTTVGGMDRRLLALEERPPPTDPRVDRLVEQMEGIQRQLQSGHPAASRAYQHEPPGDAADPPPGLRNYMGVPQGQDKNFSHLVLGGWPLDTPRGVLDADAWSFIRTWQVADAEQVDKVVVYGRRAQVAHVLLKTMPYEEAKERYYRLREAYNEKYQCQPGDLLWLSPSKPLAARLRNKATKAARDKLELLCGGNQVAKDSVDTDWGKQIVWLRDTRVAAGNAASLLAATGSRVVVRRWRAEQGEDMLFHFNVSAIASILESPEGEVETNLQTD